MTSPTEVITALVHHGSCDIPYVPGCEEFLCRRFSSQKEVTTTAANLRFKRFKNKSCKTRHRKHSFNTCNLVPAYSQSTYASLCSERRFYSLGWAQDTEHSCLPVLCRVPPAPLAVVELFRWRCGVRKCSRLSTCRRNNLVCSEMCNCGAEDCANIEQQHIEHDEESEGRT